MHLAPLPPRWQRRPDARPEEILDAAVVVFGEHGFARTKLDDVARRAGVSKGTLYLYFDSKEALFRAMVEARIASAVAGAEARFAAHTGTARAFLAEFIAEFFRVLRTGDMARIGRLVTSELSAYPDLGRFYFETVILRMRRLVEHILERGVASGEFRALPHGFGARGLPAMLVHLAQSQAFFRQFDPDALDDARLVEGAIDFALHALEARHA